MRSISPEELKEMLDAGRPLRLIDVRDSWEFDLCRIAASENIPMSELPERIDLLDRDAELVIICHHGTRSAQAAAYLENAGFGSVANLEGGVDGWAAAIDPDMPQY